MCNPVRPQTTVPRADKAALTSPSSFPDAPARPSELAASYAAALTESPRSFESGYTIAGLPVLLRFANEAMFGRLTRALAHLETAQLEPALTVHLWDSSASPAPTLPAYHPDPSAPGAVIHFREGPLHALYQPALRALSVLDDEQSVGWFWTEEALRLPEWECATPIRHILHWWLASQGVQQLHAAAVGTPSGGVLVVGKGGSGKSTVALASLAAGFLYAGDDYVAASLDEEPVVHSLYSSGKIEPHHVERFPHLLTAQRIEPETDPATAPFDRDKTVVYLHESHPATDTQGFRIRAILIPRIVGHGETLLSPVPRARALAALAPSTVVQLHTAGQEALGSMRELVGRVPSFELALGANVEDAPNVIRDLLERLTPTDEAAR
jgi:hypothetical protein